ncbi:hypothetical protein ABFX02_06G080700 [Erythranthe guttata]
MKTLNRASWWNCASLLGAPTFVQLQTDRFKCAETGHKLPAHADSNHCRLGFVSRQKGI